VRLPPPPGPPRGGRFRLTHTALGEKDDRERPRQHLAAGAVGPRPLAGLARSAGTYTPAMVLYLDMCCIKRPFDDQSQPRIRLESEAVLTMLAAESAALRFVRSAALFLENEQNPLPFRAARVRSWLKAADPIADAAAIASRADELKTLGLKTFDALHVASAEAAAADLFVTCDDRLVAASRKAASLLRVRVLGVLEAAAEVLP